MLIDKNVSMYIVNSSGVDRRVRLYFRQNSRCYWCRRIMIVGDPWNRPRSATEDHLMARAYGGKSTMDNLVGACLRCNSLRYELSSSFFRHLIFIFGKKLPERGTSEFSLLQRAVRHSLDGKKIRVRIPIQSKAIVCDDVSIPDRACPFTIGSKDSS